MADSSLAEYIKANKIKPNRNPGAPNKGPKKPGQQKKNKNQNLQKTKQGGVKKAKNQQNVKKGKNQQNVKKGKNQQNVKKAKNQMNGFVGGQATKKWRPKAANNIVKNFQSFNKPAAPQVQIKTGPAKIQITNLDFNVTEDDVKELFGEFGGLKKAAIHFTAQGKSMGVADLVYARRADAIKAIKQYNGVQLDGRPMKIHLQDQQQQQQQPKKPNILKRLSRGAAPITKGMRGNTKGRGNLRGTFKPRGQRGTFKARGGQRGAFNNRGGQRGTFKQRGGARGGAAAKGAKKQVKKKQVKKEVTVEDLDKQLDAYIQAKS